MSKSFNRRRIRGLVGNTIAYSCALFIPAHTIYWWRAWVLLVLLTVGAVATLFGAFGIRQDLLNERLKGVIQRGQPWIDRVIIVTFMLVYGVSIVLIPLDVFRHHWLPRPGLVVSTLGMGMLLAGWWVILRVFKENAFAAPVVRHQAEREHHVVDTGVYAVVRHPMYAGIFLFNVGIALWLESYVGAIAALAPMAVLAVRIVFEERFLRRELPGYADYAERVRARLIPFVW